MHIIGGLPTARGDNGDSGGTRYREAGCAVRVGERRHLACIRSYDFRGPDRPFDARGRTGNAKEPIKRWAMEMPK